MKKTKRSIEMALGILERKIEILQNFFEEYAYQQQTRVAHHSDSEHFAQSFMMSEKKRNEIFFKAFERKLQELEQEYSDEKVDKILAWLESEGVLDLEKENQLNKICDTKIKSGKNFVFQVIASDIQKEFYFKQGKIDIEKYQTALSFTKKIKDMYNFHHKIGYIEDDKS